MATYDELFPDQPQEPFVPIETGRVAPELRQARNRARTALDTDAPDGGFNNAFGDLALQAPTASPSGGEVSAGDWGRRAIAGLGELGGAAAGAGEYLSSRVAGERNTPFEQGFGDLADVFAGGRHTSGEFAQDWYSSMSPEAQERAAREVMTLDPSRTIWQGGVGEFLSSVGLKMAGAAPSTLVTLLPGALIMRAGMGRGALTYLGASEGGLSMGSVAANVATEIEQAPEEELMQSQRYQQLRQEYPEAVARQQLISEAQGYTPVIAGLVVGAISAAAGRYLEPVFAGKSGGVLSRFGRGFTSEGVQESGQSGAEQTAQNVAAQVFDTARGTFEGVPEAMGQGALVGGAMGGATLAAVGPRPQPRTAIPSSEEAPAPAVGAAPDSFQDVFRQQNPPPGGWRGGDIETGSLPDIDSTGQRLIDAGPVDGAIQAALNARAANMIPDMFEQGISPQQEQQAYVQNPWPMGQGEMDLPQASTEMVPSGPPSQLPLGIRERVRGAPPQVIEPNAGQPFVEDMSAPAGFSQERQLGDLGNRPTIADFMRRRAAQDYAGTVRDPRQMDMLAEQQLMPDEPSAEPMGDLNAQLADLADPDSPRLGVYLAAANMQQVGDVPSVGVPLADFDGKGGTLIAKNRQVAEELLAMRDQGAADMQEILGLATGAGSGKQLGADIAVQQRDEQGNVVRESLVATPEEADVLATEFDEPGREGVVISAGMAIKRRAQRVAAEQQARRQQGVAKKARRGVEDTDVDDAVLEADAKEIAVQYQTLKTQLADAEKAQSDAPTRKARFKARATAARIGKEMDSLREKAEQEASRLRKPEQFADTRKSLEELQDDQISKLPDEQVEELFREAANVASGSRVSRAATKDETREVADAGATTTFTPHGKTLEEILAAYPTRSEKLKLVSRVKRMLRRRATGGKTKTAPITATATAEKTEVTYSRGFQQVGEVRNDPYTASAFTPVEYKEEKTTRQLPAKRKSELQPTRALDTEPPREMSAQERLKHNARVRKTYSGLDKTMQAFGTRALELNTQLATASEERENDGNPPHEARNAIYGRAYLNTLLRYGEMLQRLHPRSTSGLKEIERFIALVDGLLDAKPDKFIAELAKATEAESDVQAKAAIRLDPTVLRGMGSRRARRELIKTDSKKRMASIRWAKRFHDVWHANAKYEQHVAPLIQKLVGYVTHDTSLFPMASERRGLGYIPTFSEMRNLRYALKAFKTEDHKELYTPLKDWFVDYGFKFDGDGDLVLAKNAAQYDYIRPPKALAQARSSFRNAPLNYNQKLAAEKTRRHKATLDRERARRARLTPAQRRREDMTLARRIEADRRKDMSYEQRRALEALDDRGLNLELLDLSQDVASLRKAGEAIGAALEGGAVGGNELLRKIAASLPSNHGYRALIDRLLSLNMDDVSVGWDRNGRIGEAFGRYAQETDTMGTTDRVIRLNRTRLEERRASGDDPSPFFVHATLHEFVHAATAGAIANNPRIKAAMWAIMRQARRAAGQQNIGLLQGLDKQGAPQELYGFRDNSVDEFVAEAFTNQQFQNKLREIKIEPDRTVWQVILDLVKRLLGLADTPQASNVLDAVLATSDKLFTGELRKTRGAESLDIKDTGVAQMIGNTIDKVMQSTRVTRSIREHAKNTIEGNKEGGSRFLLSALTMEQIRDFYGRNFGGTLSKYMNAFFQRNADNSANMEQADRLSRRWTALTEEHGADEAVKLSQLMSESTLYGVHPDEPLQSKANAHVTSIQQRQRHADLSKRYRALNGDFRKLYHDVAAFYDESLRREVNLMTLNALRGAVDGDFKYDEEDVTRKKLNTMEGMEKEFGDRLSKESRKVISRMARLPDMRIGPYFPLMRFGEYVVTAEKTRERKHFKDNRAALDYAQAQREEDPTLSVSSPIEDDTGWFVTVKEKEVRMAETPSEAEQNRQDMIVEYGVENVDREIQRRSQLYSRGATIDSGSGLKSILSKLEGNPAAQAAIKDFYLRSLSDGAFRKREIKRANRRGVDYDTQHRTFASYAKSAAYYTSQLRYGWQMAESLIDMDKYARKVAKGEAQSDISVVRMNDVVDEINTRDKLTHDHVEVSKLVRGGTELSQFMMLTSPSYWLINATQPYMVTLPWLAARSSIGEATAALATAQKLILSPIMNQMGESFGGLKALWSKAGAEKAFTVLEQVEEHIEKRGGARAGEYINMLNKLKRDSIIDLSFVAELRDIAEGQNTSATQRVLDASRIMSHLTEVNNRIMSALAAYDLYRNKGATALEAQEFAKQAVSLTQFNYSSGNAPRLFQARGPLGQMGPLVFQFMKYPQHMYALLVDNFRRAVWSGGMDRKVAIKTLVGLVSTHLAAGGIIGAMIQPMKWAVGLIMAAFGDDDEPYSVANAMSGETFDRLVREAIAELFGNEMGEILSAGLPRAAGIDLSNRMSLGTLYFIDMKTDTAESTVGSLVSSFGGPLANLRMGFWKGAQYISEGQISKGMEAFMPKAAKDVTKMIRYTNEGLTDATGKEILGADKMSPWQLFAQSIGFQPSKVSETYARRAAIKDAQSHDVQRRNTLMRRFRNADASERPAVIQDIVEFNKANPAASISRSQLLKSVQAFKERALRSSRFGVDLQGDDVAYLEEGEMYEVD